MNYATVCSGIEAPSVAWHPIGWNPIWFSEIDRFPSAVLKHHYPFVPNLGDMTKIHKTDEFKESIGTVDLFCGGTPCQSFSVAGLRKGMDDPRGNLALVFLGIVDRLRPRWVVWENVPGVLSSNGGRDFGAFLGALGQIGYGWAYRVLDAQYFGVAQRRRRVFVVGHLGDWRRAAAVLFERHSVSGHPAPRREKGQRTAGTLTQSAKGSGGIGYSNQELFSQNGDGLITPDDTKTYRWQNKVDGLVEDDIAASLRAKGTTTDERSVGAYLLDQPYQVANCLTARTHKGINSTVDKGQTPVLAFAKNQMGEVRTGEVANMINTNSNASGRNTPMVFQQNSRDEVRYIGGDGQIVGALAAQAGAKQQNYLENKMSVRRLTPRECERLQGFPDDYTKITYRGKPADQCPDGPRYKALGNSMAVTVMRWIGERIEMVSKIETK